MVGVGAAGGMPVTRAPAEAARGPARVTVIGGGAAGVLLTIELLRQAARPLAITILEPRERLGAGVAYSTAEPHHIINVPASRMSGDPDDPAAFTSWLARHADARQAGESEVYPRRQRFGVYLQEALDQAVAAHPAVSVVRRRHRACDLLRTDDGLVVETDAGTIVSDAVVLATGNPAPSLPAVLRPIAAAPSCIADPWRPGVLAAIAKQARVLIVGTGLTMGDTVAGLRAAGHTGPIVAVSRRGQIPQRGLATPVEFFGAFRMAPTTALGLLRLFRAEVRRAAEAGVSWHAVLAGARREGWGLWAALPAREQRRAVRHLRHAYELHRHVMPGPVHDLIEAERTAGSLTILAARLRHARLVGAQVEVGWQPRSASPLTVEHHLFDAVVNCTGPVYADLAHTDPFWAAMTRRGLVDQDDTGIGPRVDRLGRAIDAAGHAQPDLVLVGTLARSAFGELTGIKEIAMQARVAAEALLRTLGAAPGPALLEGVRETTA